MVAGARILIVEDHQIVVQDLRTTIARLGHDTIGVASSGEEAMRLADQLRPDLVLMDIVLQGEVDGIEAAHEINKRMDVPIVYLTAYSESATIERAKKTAPHGYIIKPFEERDIRTTIDLALYRHRLEKEVRESARRLAGILKSVDNAVIAVNKEQRIIFMNRLAEKLISRSSNDSVGKPVREVLHLRFETDDRRVEDPVTLRVDDGPNERSFSQLMLISADGRGIPVDCGIGEMEEEGEKEAAGYVLALRDVTERKVAQDSLRENLAELEQRGGELRSQNERLVAAQAALEEERRRYQALFDFAPDGYLVTDHSGTITEANAAAAMMLRDSQAALPGQSLVSFIDEQSASEFFDRLDKLTSGAIGRYTDWGITFQRLDRSKLECDVTVTADRASGLEEIALRWLIHDVADRREAELAFEISEKRFRAIVENSIDVIAFVDRDGIIQYVSPSIEPTLGYNPQEILGRAATEFIHPENQSLLITGLEQLIERQSDIRKVHFRLRHKDGSWRWIDASAKNLLNDLHVRSVVVNCRDITDWKRAEDEREQVLLELSRKNADLDALFRVTTSAISTLNMTELHDSVLTSLVAVTHADVAVIWLCENNHVVVHAGIHEREEGGIGYSLEMGQGVAGEVARTGQSLFITEGSSDKRVRNPFFRKGNYRSFLAVPLVHDEKVIGVLEVGWLQLQPNRQKITRLLEIMANRCAMAILNAQLYEETKRFQAELERKVDERTRQLAESNRELEAFSYSVSHDLRAPLRAINGFAGALLEDHFEHLDAEGKNYLKEIRRNTQMMGKLIDELLAFSRLGRREFTRTPIDMNQLVRSVLEDVQRAECDRNAEIIISDLHTTIGDSSMIRQVLVNLVDNAFKFTRTKPYPQVQIGSSQNEKEVIFFVRDNGVGFDMQYVGKLFGVFQRLHPIEEYDGTGVGLAIVQRIVIRHGGRVWAEGAPGLGATFYFSIPHQTIEEEGSEADIFSWGRVVSGHGLG